MNVVSMIVLGLMGALLAYSVLSIFISIVRNLKNGFRFRQDLAGRIGNLRLRKMLGSLGIDLSGYLHSRPVAEIEGHMRACQGCETQSTCDERLGPAQKPIDDYSFCPNYESLKEAQVGLQSPEALAGAQKS
jgi:hypothetical protein